MFHDDLPRHHGAQKLPNKIIFRILPLRRQRWSPLARALSNSSVRTAMTCSSSRCLASGRWSRLVFMGRLTAESRRLATVASGRKSFFIRRSERDARSRQHAQCRPCVEWANSDQNRVLTRSTSGHAAASDGAGHASDRCNPWRHPGRSDVAAGAYSPSRALGFPATHDASPRRCEDHLGSGRPPLRRPRDRPGCATRPAGPRRTLAKKELLCAPIRGQTD
jgi:hypothetical protein